MDICSGVCEDPKREGRSSKASVGIRINVLFVTYREPTEVYLSFSKRFFDDFHETRRVQTIF